MTHSQATPRKFARLIQLTANLLNDMIQQDNYDCESIFNANTLCRLPLQAFMQHVQTLTKFSDECLLVSIKYLDRYNLSNEHFSLNSYNVHRIWLACIILATKFQDDHFYNNKAFQMASGVNTTHLMQLEMELYRELKYNAFVSQQQYEQLHEKLHQVYAEVQQPQKNEKIVSDLQLSRQETAFK